MELSVQLSYYPLSEDFKPAVRALISHLEESGLTVESNRMSTQIFGEFEQVMSVFADALQWSFKTYGRAVFTASFMEGDRRPRQPKTP